MCICSYDAKICQGSNIESIKLTLESTSNKTLMKSHIEFPIAAGRNKYARA